MTFGLVGTRCSLALEKAGMSENTLVLFLSGSGSGSATMAVRQGNWKVVYDAEHSRRWELYDMAAVPTELDNLSAGRQPL